jgi:hypothetical protein
MNRMSRGFRLVVFWWVCVGNQSGSAGCGRGACGTSDEEDDQQGWKFPQLRAGFPGNCQQAFIVCCLRSLHRHRSARFLAYFFLYSTHSEYQQVSDFCKEPPITHMLDIDMKQFFELPCSRYAATLLTTLMHLSPFAANKSSGSSSCSLECQRLSTQRSLIFVVIA